MTPQDSEPIRLSNEDERVDQSSVSNNGKVSLRFLWRCAGNQNSVISVGEGNELTRLRLLTTLQ